MVIFNSLKVKTSITGKVKRFKNLDIVKILIKLLVF